MITARRGRSIGRSAFLIVRTRWATWFSRQSSGQPVIVSDSCAQTTAANRLLGAQPIDAAIGIVRDQHAAVGEQQQPTRAAPHRLSLIPAADEIVHPNRLAIF